MCWPYPETALQPEARGEMWSQGTVKASASLPWPVPTGNQPLLQQEKGRLIKLRSSLNLFSLISGLWVLRNGDCLAHMGLGFRGCFHKLTHLDLRCPAVDQRSLSHVMETPDLVQIHHLVQMHLTALWHTLILGTFLPSPELCVSFRLTSCGQLTQSCSTSHHVLRLIQQKCVCARSRLNLSCHKTSE